MKKIFLLFILLLPIVVNAKTLNESCLIKLGEVLQQNLNDEKYTTYTNYGKDEILTITCEEEIKNIYIMYNVKSITGAISYNNIIEPIGTNNYLNEFISLKEPTKEIKLKYDEDYSISNIYLLDDDVPSWVQKWESLDKADLMLFSTHADDEQLFFAGLMPTYINKGYKIQVIYFTNHYNNTNRYHEQLEGLWTIGIKYYPVISNFPDAYSTSLEGAISNLNSSGYSEEDALAFEVDQIRKYKPYVIVGHDEKGEYSHGQHILNTHVLKDAVLKANDSDYQTTNGYEAWEVQKLYLHLYNENTIVLNYDLPLENYNNKTAYEVSKEGYSKHYSQQYTWFTEWLNGPNNSFKSATEIKTYNPAHYGLYYSSVGEDVNKNDMFENIKFPIIEQIENTITNQINKIENKAKKIIFKKKELIIGISIILISILGITFIIRKK